MTNDAATVVAGVIVEETVRFTLAELSRACRVDSGRLTTLVIEGVLTPSGDDAASWQFDGDSLRRARSALRLSHDLELNVADTGFVLDLLDEIESLKARLRHLGDQASRDRRA